MTCRSERDHDRLVSYVARRLKSKGYYCVVEHVKYHRGKNEGECDIMARRNGIMNYYEIKLRDGRSQRKKAKSQIERWAEMDEGIEKRGIYVSFSDSGIVARRVR